MDMTVQQLADLNVSALESAKEEWARISSSLEGYGDRVDIHMRRTVGNWTGDAAVKAHSRMERLRNNFQFGAQECALVRAAIDAFIEEIQGSQRKMQDVLDVAKRTGFLVTPMGELVDPAGAEPPGGEDPEAARKRDERREELQRFIFAVLGQAVETDAKYGQILSQLMAERGLKVDGLESQRDANIISKVAAPGLRLDSVPEKGTDPANVRDWWKGMSEEERQEQLALHPDLIGNLDGIPARTRDKANRVNLDRLIDMYPEPVPDDVEERHEGFKKIRNRLIMDAEEEPEPLLLGIGPEGQGRAILSYGDPDTADNVAAYVPGLNTQLGDVGGDDGDRARDVWKSAQKADGGGHKTASIVWLGYDAPQAFSDSDAGTDASVAEEERGRRGGRDFGRFLDGIQATHQGERPHVTAIGHSYGSFTLGQAAQREGGIPADDIILVGSPGTGAQRAEDLGVSPDHVWAGAADSDAVTHAPSDAEKIFGIWGHMTDPHELHFGQDPASEDFGGRRFAVNPGWNPSSHSDYFDRNSESLRNMGKIVSGRPGEVTTEERR
ncbi:alpha/beta hydrolase [Streptomyces chattanoogensis]|uniref:alpha/beta hydrolase n=1 Tax=Streptomyces chattanoogensis TaxID=66876 RepID=UPI0006B480BD|nr:alpha/beta hydrolase [Streptomyces chattanoogensis]